ncbi:hypothetical protein BD626DRAFT_183664 [Schizophyllum amplum]|uniref:Uncharacterized protein n=1 Tax=Schizophyllum amplum TaxID=97359 RepID=A0A550C1B7_9AGAR|nr:hypothetical protein BD626DRAFT_183664 [Auriculariopsis ampla]
MALPVLTHSRGGFLLVTTETPEVRKRRARTLGDLYPRYGYGWVYSDEELEEMSKKRFGHTRGQENALVTVWERWEAAGGSPEDLHCTHILLKENYEVLLYVSDNTTRKKLELPSDAEFLAKAKTAAGKEEDGRWYHLDTF